MRTLGIDLAVRAAHKAIVADEHGRYVTPVLSFHTRPEEIERVLAQAREGASEPAVQAVMEPTGMAWFPLAAYLMRQHIPVFVVKSQEVADLRRYYKRHAKSDRIDARVLASLPHVNPDQLHPLVLPSAPALACQRGCKQLNRWQTQITAIHNRLLALDRFAWPGLPERFWGDPFSAAAGWFREHWYDPAQVVQQGAAGLRQQWCASGLAPDDPADWAPALVQLATQVLTLYGSDGRYLDYTLLQAEACREQVVLQFLETQHHTLQLKTVHPLYRQLHPSRNLETIKGVGQDGAAVYASFIGVVARFATNRAFRGWTGMVPNSKQSSASEVQGLHITQAGPELVKKFAYLDAESARQWDPQIAAIYYDQMVKRGKHHNQAVCTCSTHLLDRVWAVLREDQPYELRDVAGHPVTVAQARQLIAEHYTVPEEVRRQNSKRRRREQCERQAEKKQKREGRRQ
jgi:transposase